MLDRFIVPIAEVNLLCMKNIFYPPSAALQPYIEWYRFFSCQKDANKDLVLQDYPRTAMDMIFCFEGQFNIAIAEGNTFDISKANFISHFDKSYQIKLTHDLQTLHVRFKPCGIYPLTRIPLGKLLNGHLPLDDLDPALKTLLVRMGEEPNDKLKIEVLEKFLIRLYQESTIHHRLIQGLELIEKERGVLNVKTLAERLHTNYKTLDRWFYQKVGLPPKRFMQLTRFKHIVANLEQDPNPDWMQIVNDFGFHDQAHFIREFQQFARTSPSAFINTHATS